MKLVTKKTAAQEASPQITRGDMHELGLKSANGFLEDAPGICNRGVAFVEWRAFCYAEMVEDYQGDVDSAGLLTAWERGFDSAQPYGLTPDELGMLKAYRLSDDRGRESIGGMALSSAEDWPRYTFRRLPRSVKDAHERT